MVGSRVRNRYRRWLSENYDRISARESVVPVCSKLSCPNTSILHFHFRQKVQQGEKLGIWVFNRKVSPNIRCHILPYLLPRSYPSDYFRKSLIPWLHHTKTQTSIPMIDKASNATLLDKKRIKFSEISPRRFWLNNRRKILMSLSGILCDHVEQVARSALETFIIR